MAPGYFEWYSPSMASDPPRNLQAETMQASAGDCRHFADNWVVAWGPGFISDLALEWDCFKAARGALGGVITAARAKDMAATYAAALPDLQNQLASFLVEGKLKVRYRFLPCSRASVLGVPTSRGAMHGHVDIWSDSASERPIYAFGQWISDRQVCTR
jgi:hypothetical protein